MIIMITSHHITAPGVPDVAGLLTLSLIMDHDHHDHITSHHSAGCAASNSSTAT
jgi:hypothetical protein